MFLRPSSVLGAAWRATPLRGGLGRRILLWFLILSLVPLLLSNLVGYLVTREIIEGQVRRYLNALTEVEAKHVATEVERHQLYLDAVVAGNALLSRNVPGAAAAVRQGRRQAPVVTTLHEHLDRKLAELHPISELLILDTEGLVIAATRHDRLGADWSERDLFQIGREGRFFAEDWDPSQEGVEPVYRLATPILDGEGRSIGVLAGIVGFSQLRDFLRVPPHLAGDVHSYLVDEEGRPLLVSHVHVPIDYGERLRSPLTDRPPGSVEQYINYEDVEVLGTSVIIPGIAWRYIAEISVESAFGQLRSLALLAGVLEAGFALLLVTVVWIVARSIVAPLRRLVDAAERIRAGVLGVEVEIDRQDELGDLGRTFNQMSGELQTSAEQIQELHDQQMRRAAQLASAGELASGIAHEIKNPLIGVASGVDLLERRLNDDPKSATVLGQMREQLKRIESAIRDLLSYAQPKKPRLIWTAPDQLVDRVVALIGSQAETAGVSIEKRVGGDARKIHVDPELMTQALVNLTLNGIQALGPGGVVGISTECVNGEVRISVSDTGAGIPKDRIEEIFRPFFTTKHQGTGLGLAITRGIVERHGGRLEVGSEEGQGSQFTLVFATTDEEAGAQ